ncbi:MAG TPA: GNAT family N-acetyltransferase [Mycobacteriales bacterium]|nr:GNAT family N-acetyltransferase [Mycobacteriales bacterium]
MGEEGGTDGDVVLTTERLVLRRFTPADADLLVDLDSDPAVMRFINGGRPTSHEEIAEEVLPCWLGHYERYEHYGFFAALDKVSGNFLGWFHLRPGGRSAPDEPELGYRFHRSAWGRGYATEGSRALVDAAFADYGARRVYAETMAANAASRRVMAKAGLHLVRTFFADWPDKIDGDEEGDVEYAVTRERWAAARVPTVLDP